MRNAFRVIRTVREKHTCTKCGRYRAGASAFTTHRAGVSGCWPVSWRQSIRNTHRCIAGRRNMPDRVLSRSVLSGWVDVCCRLLSPLDEALQGYILSDDKLHADDTPVPRSCCRATKKRRPGAYGRTFATTATRVLRWPRRCGSCTARTEKVSTRRAILPASAVCWRRMPMQASTNSTGKGI
ncbi:Transposase and inactivated derivatives [Raoultella terrigena]|uniref:Transposase and inactivated derivatives n=1 Tax=Raoultella terrigena TaxID=577 RepID=A0A3P8KZJ0_RAOTE|nr:Transposase and inactivated derivatives [Raoultella terrigena]